MSIAKRGKPRPFDGKQVFILWYETGSLEKTHRHLINLGFINPRTGKPYVRMVVWFTAMRWVINHPEDAREYYIKDGADFALNDEQWNRFLIRKAQTIYPGKKRFLSWIERMGFGDKYIDIYANRCGLKKWE